MPSDIPYQDCGDRICIIGGGATGVELSAELYNAAKALRNYGLEVFDESKLEVTLVEAGPRILPQIDAELAGTARHELVARRWRIRGSPYLCSRTGPSGPRRSRSPSVIAPT